MSPTEIGFALLAFGTLLAMIDPLAAVPVYLSTTKHYTTEHRAHTLRRAIVTAFVLLVGFGLLGTWIFRIFGITTEAFRIAGGVILFGVGMDMLQARRSRTKATAEEEAEGLHSEDVGIVPLGTPMLAGPGALSSVITLMAQAHTVAAQITVYAAVTLVLLIVWGTLRVAPRVVAHLGTMGMHAIERVMGLIVMVLGVQFVLDGIQDVVLRWMRMG